MTPDIKGLVERLRNYESNERRNNFAEVCYWLNQYRKLAKDALERLSTPPAVPATPVEPALYGYVYPDGISESGTVIRFETGGRTINGSRPLYTIPYYAAPVPAHSDVREAQAKAVCKIIWGTDDLAYVAEGTKNHCLQIVDAVNALSTTAQSGDQK